jgi:hypothetical protein
METNYIDRISFVFFLIAIALVAVFVINTGNIKLLSYQTTVIEKQDDYKLEEFPTDSFIDITLTPSKVFKLDEEVNGNNYSIFSTEEYVFDFIVIFDKYPETKVSLECRDVTNVQRNLLDTLLEEFNNPVDVAAVLEQEGIVLSEESKDSLYQNTTGRFGTATRLLDCTEGVVRTQAEIYFIIGAEVLAILIALGFIFRNKLSALFDDDPETN